MQGKVLKSLFEFDRLTYTLLPLFFLYVMKTEEHYLKESLGSLYAQLHSLP